MASIPKTTTETMLPYYTKDDASNRPAYEVDDNYFVDDDRKTYCRDSKGQDRLVIEGFVVCKEQNRDEKGNTTYVLYGYDANTKKEFSLEVTAADFISPKDLKVALLKGFDFRTKMHLNKGERLEDVIRSTTREGAYQSQTVVKQVKWIGDKLIIPGMEPDGYKCSIKEQKFPYNMPDDCGTKTGLDALGYIINAYGATKTLPVVVMELTAPIIGKEFPNDRYGFMLSGSSGVGKTLLATLLQSMYGQEFQNKSSLIKLGSSDTTPVSIRLLSAQAGPMPVLWDNFKPLADWSESNLTSTIHGVIEGTDKERGAIGLTDIEVRDSLEFRCCLLLT
ncbi:MAG: hypothetical protein WB392_14600, partial [Methanotrichaceae archaeon]